MSPKTPLGIERGVEENVPLINPAPSRSTSRKHNSTHLDVRPCGRKVNMDPVSLAFRAASVTNSLLTMREEVLWNKAESKRLLKRIEGLLIPLEKIKSRSAPIASQKQLLMNILVTIEDATEFLSEFRQK